MSKEKGSNLAIFTLAGSILISSVIVSMNQVNAHSTSATKKEFLALKQCINNFSNYSEELIEYLGSDELEIANEIWEMYGGNEEGSVIEANVGERIKNKEADDKEIENTQDTKWKRLPEGKTLMTLNPPVTLDKLYNAVKYMSFGIAKNKSKEQGAGGPGGGGGMPGLASHNYKNMVKIGKILDELGHYSISDRLMP